MSHSLPARTTALVPVRRAAAYSPATVYLARLASGSRRSMEQALVTIAGLLSGGSCTAATLPWHQLEYQHTAAIRSELSNGTSSYSPATVNKMLSALRGVLKEAWRLGQKSAEAYQRASDIKGVSGECLPRGRALGPGELVAIFTACRSDETVAGRRDAALLAVLYGAGLRRSEAVLLDTGDYGEADRSLKVRGKGNKQRLVPLPAGTRDALDQWMAVTGSGAMGGIITPSARSRAVDRVPGQGLAMERRRRAIAIERRRHGLA